MAEKLHLYKEAEKVFEPADRLRPAFIAAIKAIENSKKDDQRERLARQVIREFMKLRVNETKMLRMIVGKVKR